MRPEALGIGGQQPSKRHAPNVGHLRIAHKCHHKHTKMDSCNIVHILHTTENMENMCTYVDAFSRTPDEADVMEWDAWEAPPQQEEERDEKTQTAKSPPNLDKTIRDARRRR